jgi:hypothetical protein
MSGEESGPHQVQVQVVWAIPGQHKPQTFPASSLPQIVTRAMGWTCNRGFTAAFAEEH